MTAHYCNSKYIKHYPTAVCSMCRTGTGNFVANLETITYMQMQIKQRKNSDADYAWYVDQREVDFIKAAIEDKTALIRSQYGCRVPECLYFIQLDSDGKITGIKDSRTNTNIIFFDSGEIVSVG